MELKPIERSDRGVNRLHAVLRIYRDTILPEAQNPERQILYWIDHAKSSIADQFRCFAITESNQVVGYLQYSYFAEEHLFFFEYLCLRDTRSRGLLPTAALDAIEDYLSANYKPDFMIVFEIAKKRNDNDGWESDNRLIAYFKRLGFRSIDFEYHYPVLQSYDGNVSYPADLIVRLPRARVEVTSSELRTILRCIYFKHYLRWDRPFLEESQFIRREQLINSLYAKEISRINAQIEFSTAGDDRRSQIIKFVPKPQGVEVLLKAIFAPKFPRICAAFLAVLAAEIVIGNAWGLVPFVLSVAILFCLAEDTANSRKLLKLLIAKLHLGRR